MTIALFFGRSNCTEISNIKWETTVDQKKVHIEGFARVSYQFYALVAGPEMHLSACAWFYLGNQ